MLRIGEIQYANVYPIFYYLKKVPSQDFKFVRGVPSYLNKMLMEGCLDTFGTKQHHVRQIPGTFFNNS